MKKIIKKSIMILVVYTWLGINFVFSETIFPRIINISPQKGEHGVDPQAAIVICFNQPMEQKSVEENFYIFPQTIGKFHWEKNKLVFKSEKPLFASTAYVVSLSAKIKGQSGICLSLTQFTTCVQGLCVSPEGKIQIVNEKLKVENLQAEGKNPVWSRDNHQIIFEQDGKILQMAHDGSNLIELTEDKTIFAEKPACNPKLDVVAYVGKNAAGVANIYSVEMRTKITRQLTAFFEVQDIASLTWSPDGHYLAFLRAGQIWLMNQNGTDLRQFTTNELGCRVNFAWSCEGTKIAFVGNENIWVGDIYSSELRKLSFDNPKIGALDWSADNKIVFESQGLIIMEADGSNEVQIASAGKMPQWMDKGRYLSFILPLFDKNNRSQLWVLSADGLQKEKLAFINAQNFSVAWSKAVDFSQLLSP